MRVLRNLVASIVFLFNLDSADSDSIPFLGVTIGGTIAFGALSFALARSQTVVTESTITSRKWYGAKTINISDITEVGFSRFYGGQFMIQSAANTLKVSSEYVGSAELITLLCEKIGPEKCTQAVSALNKRKEELSRLG